MKKARTNMPSGLPDGRRLIARAIALAAVVFFFQVAVAQNVRISVDFQDIPLKEALKGIEKKCDYTFLYSDSQVDINRKVSLIAHNEELKSILVKLLGGQYYVVNNKRIVLTAGMGKSTVVSRNMQQVTGTVKDENGDPLMGASVRVKDTDIAVATDIDGQFSLQAPEGSTIEVTVADSTMAKLPEKATSRL
ncbi:MAG: carboxypeptidase-like regulatory domain-containing protein [Duncaniella sp.]|nr:carboxypeptidase-like regulatory domain-containing protein [Duncaniella sp.]